MNDTIPSDHSNNSTPAPEETEGWQTLLKGFPWFEGEGHYPLPAYSEFMPPPRFGRYPYGGFDPSVYDGNDPYGWQISELEQEYELKPGIEMIARTIVDHIVRLGKGEKGSHVPGKNGQNLIDNLYWPPELAAHAGNLPAERYVILLPIALSRTQDDKGRVRWTLFGNSEQQPEKAFWKGFYTNPRQELPAEGSFGFICRLLSEVYGEKVADTQQLFMAGFRILLSNRDKDKGSSGEDLPSWTSPLIVNDQSDFTSIRYLLTFRPFSYLPAIVRERYFASSLALLPFPGSLVFWGMGLYHDLQKNIHFATQIPLLHLFRQHSGPSGIRVPASGWFDEPEKPTGVQDELLTTVIHQPHRWEHKHVFEDDLAINPNLVKVAKNLFSNDPQTMGLYDKPLARNCQLWENDLDKNKFIYRLDGPHAHQKEIYEAKEFLFKEDEEEKAKKRDKEEKEGEKKSTEQKRFGYRLFYPAMQVGKHEIYLHYLLAAYPSQDTAETRLIQDAPTGYLTAYLQGSINLDHPTELWPRLLRRPAYLSAVWKFDTIHDYYPHQTALNIITLLETYRLRGPQLLPRSFARALLRVANDENLDHWMSNLPIHANQPEAGYEMQQQLNQILEPVDQPLTDSTDLTYKYTATRVFETAYWNDIFTLSHGNYHTKDNADPVVGIETQDLITYHRRDLDQLGNYLIARHRDAIDKAGMAGRAFCVEMNFKWKTDFVYSMYGGWKRNFDGDAHERNILVIIPGRDHNQAVVLADHYDTAYMEDLYEASRHGVGVRVAADGADDNYSATAALLQAAPIYLNLAREGRLERDIWLLHLTGEEFPSDCLGARHFAQALVEKTLKIQMEDKPEEGWNNVRIVGVFVMDMIAHNNVKDKDVFQISPGKSAESLELAYQAHLANRIWNGKTEEWNKQEGRRGKGRGKVSPDGVTIPEIADTLRLNGEVRTSTQPLASLFNTDGQIFSDAGVPVVLFMENYDINRTGYHDTHDTMANIDLDYGAALAAIAIETTARVASRP